MTIYYRECESGDYLAIETDTNAYYRQHGWDYFEGRATAIAKEVYSVCTVGLSREFLRKKCKRIAKCRVPKVWLEVIG